MRIYRGIAVTDEPNLQGVTVPLSVISTAYNQQWDDFLPSFLAHDATKPRGFSRFDGIVVEPKRAYLLNTFYETESENERRSIKKINYRKLISQYCQIYKEELNELKSKIEGNIEGDCYVYPVQAAAYYNKGIVCRVYPKIRDLMDEKGLVDLKALTPVHPGIFKCDNFLIFAHRYFRRNLSYYNCFNQAFLKAFQALKKEDRLTLKIAIDLDFIGLAGTEKTEFEFQYWYGPKFNNDLSCIPVGVTRHENEFYKMGFTDTLFTEFWWYVQDDRKTFECEEVNDKPNISNEGIKYCGCRFVHSMLDYSIGNPVHMDGAIRAYNEDQMIDRIDTDIKTAGRHTDYKKLWRIDGDISVKVWKKLLTHYYQDNFQVGEYLGGKDKTFDELRSNMFIDKNIVTADKYIPCDMQAGDGIIIYYRIVTGQSTQKKYDVFINSNQYLKYGEDKQQKVVEAETVTLIKLIKTYGAKTYFPNYDLVCCEDMIVNFPMFVCKNIDASNCVQKSIIQLCSVWHKLGHDRIISYSLKIERYYSDGRGVYLSFAGHVDDFLFLSNKINWCIPEESDFQQWIEQLYHSNKLLKGYDDTKFKTLLQSTGELQFRRQFVARDRVNRIWVENGTCNASIYEKAEDVCEIKRRHLHLAPFSLIKSSCSKCGKSYRTCNHIKFVDDGITENIDKCKPIGVTWTNRHAQDLPDLSFHSVIDSNFV